jgi:hypothetical protein
MARHYPEIRPPAAQNDAGFIAAIKRQFFPALNRELRMIVDQIPTVGNFAGNEVVGGTIDGTNATFVLLHEPNPAESLMLFNVDSGGITHLLVRDIDYALGASTVTIILAGSIPAAGDALYAWYRWIS